jgi:hypothetical protein
MKRSMLSVGSKMVTAVIILLGVTVVATRAQETSCRNSTLKGDYAFTVSGQVFLPVKAVDGTITTVVVQRDGIAMTHFDGEGHLSQVDFVLSSPDAPTPVPPPPAPPPTIRLRAFTTWRLERTPCSPTVPELLRSTHPKPAQPLASNLC